MVIFMHTRLVQGKFYNVDRQNKMFLLIGYIESSLNEFEQFRVIREAAYNFRERETHESCPE